MSTHKRTRISTPRFSHDFLESLKQRVVLSDVVGEHVSLKRRGSDYVGLCPFHQEKTPSFSVSDEKGLYYCFGCGAGGSCYDFIKHIKGLKFTEVVEELALRAGMVLPTVRDKDIKGYEEKTEAFQALEVVTRWYEENLLLPENKDIRSYLASRGINESLQKRFRLGYAPQNSGMFLKKMEEKGLMAPFLEKIGMVGSEREGPGESRFWERFRGRLMFPIIDKTGNVIAFGGRALTDVTPKYLNSPETFLFHKSRTLYGMNEVKKHRSLLKENGLAIVEGYSDVIRLWEYGVPAVAPLGTALSMDHIQEAWLLSQEPVITFDGDEAGQKAAMRAVEKAFEIVKPGYSLKFCVLPPHQDPDSFIQTFGIGHFRTLWEKAIPMIDFFWIYSLAHSRIDTPEFQVLFKDTLMHKMSHIASKDIRAAYERELLRRYYERFSKEGSFYKKGQGRFAKSARKVFPPDNSIRRCYDKRGIQEKILIMSLVVYPELMKECLERVCSVEMKAGDLCSLREALIDYYETQQPLETESVKDYLSRIAEISIEPLIDAQVLLYAPFLKKRVSNEEVKVLWEEIWTHMQDRGDVVTQEYKEMKALLQDQGTQEAWLRLKAFYHIREEEKKEEA